MFKELRRTEVPIGNLAFVETMMFQAMAAGPVFENLQVTLPMKLNAAVPPFPLL